MALKLVTRVEDGLGTVGKCIEATTAEDFEMLQQVFQRATNLWPDAPPAVKELADKITNGKIMQDYRSQDTSPKTDTRARAPWLCLLCLSNSRDNHIPGCPNKGK